MAGCEVACVYALLDADGRPRYVGNSGRVEARVRDHWKQRRSVRLNRVNPGFGAWLQSLPARPDYRVIGQVRYADRFRWEKFYTDRLRERGFSLLNINSGMSPAHHARMLEASKSPEALAKLRASLAGAGSRRPPVSEETRARMSAAHKGRKWTAEALVKRSASMRGQKRLPEARARMSAAQKARRISMEVA